jgi:hypothetical protein
MGGVFCCYWTTNKAGAVKLLEMLRELPILWIWFCRSFARKNCRNFRSFPLLLDSLQFGGKVAKVIGQKLPLDA